MKVLFYFGRNARGGAERVIVNLGNELAKSGHSVVFMNDYRDDPESYEVDSKVVRHYLSDHVKTKNRIIKNLKRIKPIKRIIETENPDLVVSFLGNTNKRILHILRNNDSKIIVSVRNDPNFEYGRNFLAKRVTNHLFKRANGVVCQTEEESAYFDKNIKDKICIIVNPVNPLFQDVNWDGKNSKEIIAVGRLSEQKNYPLLIDAFKIASQNDPELHLSIYGKGTEFELIKDRIKLNGLADRVSLKGEVKDLRQIYSSCRFYVLSSLHEGLPNTLMEAMTVGAPCISTDCSGGGPSYLLGDSEYGLLVKNNDIQELAEAMIKMSNDDALRFKYAGAAKKKATDFRSEKIFAEWMDYFEKVVKGTHL